MPLYPFYHGLVTIGISKFGETVNPYTHVGFQYMDASGKPYDPIVNSAVDINEVIAGWKLVVTYNRAGVFRTVWAYAKFSDFYAAGSPADGIYAGAACNKVAGGWILCPYATNMTDSPALDMHGGRKTNGYVVTQPLTVIYSGPRRWVAVSENVLYDSTTVANPVAAFSITFDFNKDKKELTMIKDVKILLGPKEALPITAANCTKHETNTGGVVYSSPFTAALSQQPGMACFELDNNEQIDQGPPVWGTAHFYTINTTAGGAINNDIDQGQLTTKILNEANGAAAYHWDNGTTSTDLTWPGAYLRPNNLTAVAQMIDIAGTHVVAKAFWPHPDWWTVDAYGTDKMFSKLDGIQTDNLAASPSVVGVAAQWNFILDGSARAQWRSVETLAVTDNHDANNANGIIDRELIFLNNEVFNPFDLVKALDPVYSRQVTYYTALGTVGGGEKVALPGIINSTWDAYASFAERVINENTGALLVRDTDYALITGATGNITFTAGAKWTLTKGTEYKILWSTAPADGKGTYEWLAVGRDSAPVDSIGAAYVSEAFDSVKDINVNMTGLDMQDPLNPTVPYILQHSGTGDTKGDYKECLVRDDQGCRAHQRDDWSTVMPVDSSNIILVGGPIANVGMEMVNDWASFVFDSKLFAGFSVGMWDLVRFNKTTGNWGINELTMKNAATIGTYMDIDGTVWFYVYGGNGQDTYWATHWLWNGNSTTGNHPGIVTLQGLNRGVLSVYLTINYLAPNCPPTITTPKSFDTISEKPIEQDP
jgi:hypothetical protein